MLYKRGNVWWSYVWRDGIRYPRSTKTNNRRRAEDIERQFKDELDSMGFEVANYQPEMPFGELLTRFLAKADVKPYHLDRVKLLLPQFAEVAIGRINHARVREYRQLRHRAKTITGATVNRDVEALRSFLSFAVEEGFLPKNPLARVPMEDEPEIYHVILSVEEELRLIAVAAPHLKPVIIVALDTGMRRGELLGQLFEHMDFSQRVISVTTSKTSGGKHREVPMTERVYNVLTALRQTTGLIFTYEGKPIHKLRRSWMTAVRNAAIRTLPFKDLRHTFNNRLVALDVVRETRRALMGHIPKRRKGRSAHDDYVQVELPVKRKAIAKLETWWKEQVEGLSQKQDAAPQGAANQNN